MRLCRKESAAAPAPCSLPLPFLTPFLTLSLPIPPLQSLCRPQVSGQKFYYLRNAGALLELALVNYAMNKVGDRLV